MPKRILLADDSITIQKVVELTFSDGDYEIITANNGARALQKLAENTPDVILSDIIMPEKNGYEVCEYVKSHPEYRYIPVILLTGTFEPFDPDRAEKAGCDAVVTKPFESQALISKVEELIARRRRADEERRGRAGMQPLESAPGPAGAVMSSAPEPEPAGEWQIPTFTPFTADPEPLGMGSPEFSPDDAPFGSGGWSEAPVAAAASEEPFGSFDEVPAASDESAFSAGSELESPPIVEPPAAEAQPPAADHEAETKAFPLISAGFETASDFQGDVPEPTAAESTLDEPEEPAEVFAAAEESRLEDPVGRTLQFPSTQPSWEDAPADGAGQESIPAERFDDSWATQQATEDNEPPAAEAAPMPPPDDFQRSDMPEELATEGGYPDSANLLSAETPFAASAAEVFTAEEDESDDYVGRPDEPAYELSSGFPASEDEEQPEERSSGAWDEPAERERGPFALPPPSEMEDGGSEGTAGAEETAPGSIPAEAAMAAAPLSDADIDRIARRVVELMSDQLVRNIAWEVIPDVAQAVVRERVRELEQA